MNILAVRTDQPAARLELRLKNQKPAVLSWSADRQLAETLHYRINDLLTGQNLSLADLDGLVVFSGPGSFTGLRIGAAAANALAYALSIPIVGAGGPRWAKEGENKLLSGRNERMVAPRYGRAANTTRPKK